MEQLHHSLPTPETDQTNIGIISIGINRYNFLRSLSADDLTEQEKEQMADYELRHTVTPEQKEYKKRYIDKITTPVVEVERTFTKKELWDLFKSAFLEVHGKEYSQADDHLENLKPIMYYFLKDENFFFCKNVSDLSLPSFDKGLLIIGNYGNGKTATMLAFEKVFKTVKGYSFKSYSANDVVEMYEASGSEETKAEFHQKMNRGVKYFDDVKTEKIASNYGKVNIFKEILEIREKNNLKTHITCNFKDGFDNNIQAALDEFSEKYGNRVHDRLFKMFNIIVFNGKSMRR